jgi:hypothetical protein
MKAASLVIADATRAFTGGVFGDTRPGRAVRVAVVPLRVQRTAVSGLSSVTHPAGLSGERQGI